MLHACAILMDIVRSRELPDRVGAQRRIEETLAVACQGLGLLAKPYASVGDEFQSVAPTLGGALVLTERVQLLLPDGLMLRYGIGEGEIQNIGGDAARVLQDGSAWWRAREAIDHAHEVQDAGAEYLLTCYRGGSDEEEQALVNALLTLRDHSLAGLGGRQRRMLAGLTSGQTQARVAAEIGVSQAAVSQFVVSKGAALLAAHRLLVVAAATVEAER